MRTHPVPRTIGGRSCDMAATLFPSMREYPNKMRKPEWDARVRLPEVVRPPRARGGRRRRRSHGGGMLSPGPGPRAAARGAGACQ